MQHPKVKMDSYGLLATFYILDSVIESEALDKVEKFIHWERFQSRASELISEYIPVYSSEEDNKAA
jgi:hypothetical protein